MPHALYAAAFAASISLFASFTPLQAQPATPFEGCQTQTGRNASVLLRPQASFYLYQPSVGISSLAPGDVVAAFTPEGVCAGAVVWEGHTVMLPLWGDNPSTSAPDGFATNDPLMLRVWDASSDAVLDGFYVFYWDLFDTAAHYAPNTISAPSVAFFAPASSARPAPASDQGRASSEKAEPMPTDAHTAMQGEPSVALPADYALDANYPNPFRSSTTIRYGLPEEATVRLDVYDLAGRRVATLVDGAQAAGWYEVEMQARDLPAGLYVYRLQANAFVSNRRMVRVR